MKPIISVVVIGYNIQNFIEECLNSLLSQSFNNYEIIFVNDGSKDRTLDVALKYKSKIKIINKDNGGIVSARKAGLKEANGNYITFVDGDDWVNHNFLENLYLPILNNENIDIVCTNYYFQKEDGSFIKYICNDSGISYCEKYDFFIGIMCDKIDHHMFPKLYKRSFLIESDYFNYPEVSMAEDWITNAFLGLYMPNVYFSETINYFYRYNISSISRNGGEDILEQIKTLEYMDLYFKNKCDFDYSKYLQYAWFSYVKAYILSNCKSSVKRKIIYSYRNKNYSYKNNDYCRNVFNQLNTKSKIKLKLEISFPELILLIDIFHGLFSKVKSNLRKINNIFQNIKKNRLYDYYVKNLSVENKNKRIILIGTSDRSNIGDHAIAFSELKFFKDNFANYQVIEITGDTFRKRRIELKESIKIDDIICVTGGGFIGDLWPEEDQMVDNIIDDYQNNKIIIFPQTIFFYDEYSLKSRKKIQKYRKHKHLYITCRDENSYILLTKYIDKNKVGLFPDMALYLDGIEPNKKSNEILLCLRCDKEKQIGENDINKIINILKNKDLVVKNGSTLSNGPNNGDIVLADREKKIKNKLNEFSKYKLIITDRLHGMILSTLASTPCIVIDNLSNKVSGVYKLWLKNVNSIFYCNDINEIESIINIVLDIEISKYSPQYLNDYKKNFVCFIKSIFED